MKLLTEALAFLMHSVLFSYLLQCSFPIFAPIVPRGAQSFRRSCKSFANNEAAQTHSCWLVCIVCECIWLNLNWFIHAVRQPCSHSESIEVMQVTIHWSVFLHFWGFYCPILWLSVTLFWTLSLMFKSESENGLLLLLFKYVFKNIYVY